MRTCPACGREVPKETLRCGVCGELLITDEWRRFLESYELADPAERQSLRDAMSEARREEFRQAREVWREVHPKDRTTTIVNPLPKVARPVRRGPPPARPVALALLPAIVGLTLVFLADSWRPGQETLLGLSLAGALVAARGGGADLRKMTLISGFLVVSLAAALSLAGF